jgi:hypothetical protein
LTLKGQHIKIEWGIKLAKKSKEKKFSLCVYGEYAKCGRSIEIKLISVNNHAT